MGNDPVTKLGIDLSEWKTGVATIKRDNKVLNSSFKKIASGLDDWKDSAEGLTAKQDQLSKRLSNHKDIVERTQKEYNKIADKFGEASKEAQNFEIKLNNEEAALNRTQKELREVNGLLDNFEKETDDATEKTSGFKKVLGAGISIAPFLAVTDAIIDVGKALFNASKQVAGTGDEIDKQSQKMGLTRRAYQEWKFIADQSGSSIETLQTGFAGLAEKVDDANKNGGEAAEMFARLKIDPSQFSTTEEAFEAVVYALQGMEDGVEKAAIASKLLGGAGEELMPVLNGTAEDIDNLRRKGEELNIYMSDEAVDAAVKYTDSMGLLRDTFNGFKNETIASLLPGLTQITDGLTGLMTGTEGAEKGIKEGAKSIVGNIVKIIPSIIKTVSLIAIAILEVAPTIIESLAQGILEALPMLLETVSTIIPILIETFVMAIPIVLETISVILPDIVEAILDAVPLIIDALLEALPDFIIMIVTLFTGIIEKLGTMIPDIVEAVLEAIPAIIDALIDSIPLIVQAGVDLFVSLVTNLPEIIAGIIEALPEIIAALVVGFADAKTEIEEAGVDLLKGLWDGIKSALGWIKEKISGLVGEIMDTFNDGFGNASPSKKTKWSGKMLGLGIGEGITDSINFVIQKANKMKDETLAALQFSTDELQAKNSSNSQSNQYNNQRTYTNTFNYTSASNTNDEVNQVDFENKMKRVFAT